MSRTELVSSAMDFAHLIGIRRGAKADAEAKKADAEKDDDDDEKKAAEDEEDDKKKAVEDDEDQAADDEDDSKAEDDDEDDKKKATKADDGGDDDEDEDSHKSASSRAVIVRGAQLQERARCARIFNCRAAAQRPDIAAHLAFGTAMSASSAIATLKALVTHRAASSNSLRAVMAQERRYEVGATSEAPPKSSPEAFAAAVMAADKKRRGEA